MKKLFLILCLSAFIATSCTKKEINSRHEGFKHNKQIDKNLLNDFVNILSRAIHNDPALRSFLKAEALKELDNDFNVIYHFSKNEIIEQNYTLEDKLKKFENYEGQLDYIVTRVPKITILIPKLPNYFSAQTWNAERDIPMVAANLLNSKKLSRTTLKYYQEHPLKLSAMEK